MITIALIILCLIGLVVVAVPSIDTSEDVGDIRCH